MLLLQSSEKILPLSQELPPLTQSQPITGEKSHVCDCGRQFKNARGMARHKHSCKKTVKLDTPEVIVSTPPSQQNETTTTQQEVSDELNTNTINPRQPNIIEDIVQVINSIYDEIVSYRQNLFKLPSGAAAKRYLREETRLIEAWTENNQSLSLIPIKMLMIMPALLMQKPCRKSNAKQHSEYLNSRLDKWDAGQFDLLLKESIRIGVFWFY